MTKKTEMPQIDDETIYQVSLTRKVERPNGVWLKPGESVRLKGLVLRGMMDAVNEYRPA